MAALELLEVPATTSLQDGGRRGYARYGVPRSGPVDVLSHRLAVRLAGVAPDDVSRAVAIEVAAQPCSVRAVGGEVGVAVAGDGAALVVDGVQVTAPAVVALRAEQEATVRARTWAYLAVAGDLDVAPVLGSRSTHPRSGLGPRVAVGDVLRVAAPRALQPGHRRAPAPGGGPLGILPAPQSDAFSDEALRRLVEDEFHTTTAFDRMGHRLDGPLLRAGDGHDIVSDGIVPGTVQVPGDGVAYVLTADHQTTGGYAKIAVLSTAALARFVRLVPGGALRFGWIAIEDARAELRAALAAIEQCVTGPVLATELALQDANLIGGVIDGGEPESR